MILKEFLSGFCQPKGLLEQDVGIMDYIKDDIDPRQIFYDAGTELSEHSEDPVMDAVVIYAWYEDGCLFIEVESK